MAFTHYMRINQPYLGEARCVKNSIGPIEIFMGHIGFKDFHPYYSAYAFVIFSDLFILTSPNKIGPGLMPDAQDVGGVFRHLSTG
jgi:hypothetical protein